MSKTTFIGVSRIFDSLENTDSRNEMTQILSDFYKNLGSKDSQILSYLILGRVAPFFVDSEFNYSEKSFISLLENLLLTKGLDDKVQEKRKDLGDIGDTLEFFSQKLNSKTKDLTLEEIYELLWEIVNTKGTGSVERKNKIIVDVLSKISPIEAKYFSRIVCGSLRFGVNAKTLLDVFSFIIQGDKGMRKELDRAYGAYADIGYICSLISQTNTVDEVKKGLESVKVQPGIPLLSRLVERVTTFEEVFERLGEEVLVQTKYDGLRCQIHKFREEDLAKKEIIWLKYLQQEANGDLFQSGQGDIKVKLFTRNLEDVTDMFPEIVESAKKMKENTFILDSEVLGWDEEAKRFLPFQDTMQRRRKHGVKDTREQVPVRSVTFDVLYLEGESLLQKHTHERIKKLDSLGTLGGIEKANTEVVTNVENLKELFDKSARDGYEGLIAKQKQGGYLPGTRNYEWIKLKKSMLKGLVDTIDLVAVGYNLGSGRRKKLGIGSILGAVYNEKEDLFEGVCNVGTGFTDQQLTNISKNLQVDVVNKRPKNVVIEKDLKPDVWIDPNYVFTVEADEVTRRKDSKQFSLRFPRLVEWERDKSVTEATTSEELKSFYRKGVK